MKDVDLIFPDCILDREKGFREVLRKLAAAARAGKDIPLDQNLTLSWPEGAFIYNPSKETELLGRGVAAGQLPGYAVLDMFHAFRVLMRELLCYRQYLEDWTPGEGSTAVERKRQLQQIATQQLAEGLDRAILRHLLPNASFDLTKKVEWLVGLERLQQCFRERLGLISIEDIAPPGEQYSEKGGDSFTIQWITYRVFVDGEPAWFVPSGTDPKAVKEDFQIVERSWKEGEQITITAEESQYIAMGLRLLTNDVIQEFVAESERIARSKE